MKHGVDHHAACGKQPDQPHRSDIDVGPHHLGSGMHIRHVQHRHDDVIVPIAPATSASQHLLEQQPPIHTIKSHPALHVDAHYVLDTKGLNDENQPFLTGSSGRGSPRFDRAMSSSFVPWGRMSHWLERHRVALLRVVVVLVCLAWTAFSSLAILTNKYVMVDLGFRYPVTVAWMGLLSTAVLSWLARAALLPRHARQALTLRECSQRFGPTGFFMALTFITGNSGYLYLTVAFVQMLKAFCPVITMVLLFAARLERVSTPLVVAVMMIAAGVAAASYGELNLSLKGLAFMLTSVVAESVRLVMTQQLLIGGAGASSGRQLHPLEGLMYISSACTLWLALAAAWIEWPTLLTHGFAAGKGGGLATVAQRPGAFLTAAMAGFGVNALAILVIKLASSLTLKVLGTCKDAALVTIGVVFLHEQVTHLQLCGYSLSLLGFLFYNAIQATRGSRSHQSLSGGATVATSPGAVSTLSSGGAKTR